MFLFSFDDDFLGGGRVMTRMFFDNGNMSVARSHGSVTKSTKKTYTDKKKKKKKKSHLSALAWSFVSLLV